MATYREARQHEQCTIVSGLVSMDPLSEPRIKVYSATSSFEAVQRTQPGDCPKSGSIVVTSTSTTNRRQA
jgi:hypothetical protein